MKRKPVKKPPSRKAAFSKSTKKTAKAHARSTRKAQRRELRFLIGSLPAVRGTLSRIARGFFDGWVSEREGRTLTYMLGAIAKMFIVEEELNLDDRLKALETLERNRGHAS
jgi:hypothetical protein